LGLGLALASLFGCKESEASEPSATPQVRHLELRPVAEDPRDHEPVSLVTFKPDDGKNNFVTEGDEAHWVVEASHPGEVPRWAVVAERPTALRWHWKNEARVCQRAIVTLAVVGHAEATLNLYAKDHRIAASAITEPIVGLPGQPVISTLVFDLPSTYHDRTETWFVELFLGPITKTRVEVCSIELLHIPARGALASVDEVPGFVRVGDDHRRAAGLSSWVPVRSVFTADADSVLSFSAALPEGFEKQPGELALEVRLADENGPRATKVYPVPGSETEARRWVDIELPIAASGERPISVTWKLLGGDTKAEVFCALTPPILARREANAPSVLLVTSDTHRADHVSGAGLRHDVRTPEIDRLMERGLWFSNCISSSNATNPSHAAILTGTSPRDTRVVDNVTALGGDAVTLAERFHDAGYLTWAVVSAGHLDDVHSGFGQGFDRISVPTDFQRKADGTIARLEDWLDTQRGLPVFVWVHLFDAHTPYDPSAEFLQSQWPGTIDPFDPTLPAPDLPAIAWALMPKGLRSVDYMTASYRAEVSSLDAQLPRLFEHPRLANGVIALTADHGESLGAHGVFWDHRGLYPQSTHVPLVLAWPDGPRGVRSDRPVTNVDLARTLLDLAGLEQVEFPGQSLVEELETAAVPRFSIASGGVAASVQHDGWLAILQLGPDRIWLGGDCHEPSPSHSLELFDLRNDSRCLDDRAADEPERAARMRAALVSWLSSATGTGFVGQTTTDEQTLSALRALGYTTEATDVSGAWIDPACVCARCAAYRR
jgi:arylsulfatase A-like enzyme